MKKFIVTLVVVAGIAACAFGPSEIALHAEAFKQQIGSKLEGRVSDGHLFEVAQVLLERQAEEMTRCRHRVFEMEERLGAAQTELKTLRKKRGEAKARAGKLEQELVRLDSSHLTGHARSRRGSVERGLVRRTAEAERLGRGIVIKSAALNQMEADREAALASLAAAEESHDEARHKLELLRSEASSLEVRESVETARRDLDCLLDIDGDLATALRELRARVSVRRYGLNGPGGDRCPSAGISSSSRASDVEESALQAAVRRIFEGVTSNHTE